MKNLRKLPAICATTLLMTGAAHATILEADSYGVDASGNWVFFANETSVLTQPIQSGSAGTISSYTIWVLGNWFTDPNGTQTKLNLELLGDHTGALPSVDDVLASVEFTVQDALTGDSFVGGQGLTYYELTWDLIGEGIETLVDEEFYVRHSGSTGQSVGISGNANRLLIQLGWAQQTSLMGVRPTSALDPTRTVLAIPSSWMTATQIQAVATPPPCRSLLVCRWRWSALARSG